MILQLFSRNFLDGTGINMAVCINWGGPFYGCLQSTCISTVYIYIYTFISTSISISIYLSLSLYHIYIYIYGSLSLSLFGPLLQRATPSPRHPRPPRPSPRRPASSPQKEHGAVSTIGGPFCRCPCDKSLILLGSILGLAIFCKLAWRLSEI